MAFPLLVLFIIPKFKQIYCELLEGEPLPWLTELIISISDILKSGAFTLPFEALLLGLWFWIGLRLYSVADSKTCQRFLWAGAVVGLCLNLLIIIALALPYLKIMEKLGADK